MKRVIRASLKASNKQHIPKPPSEVLKCTFTLAEFVDFIKAIKNDESFECYFEPTLVDCGEVAIGENPSLEKYNRSAKN